ncbi:transposase [Streptomyces sp. t39]|uniref:transposase n=1 Tax=Streptomyces sp. t39 TaxID=1828156 RepID=UPI0021C9EE6E|nr:transposase [Streptomyces sp. t39]
MHTRAGRPVWEQGGFSCGHPLHRRHRAEEFEKFLVKLDKEGQAGLAIHLVLDNYTTHKTPAVKTWLLAPPRLRPHCTPTGSPGSTWWSGGSPS